MKSFRNFLNESKELDISNLESILGDKFKEFIDVRGKPLKKSDGVYDVTIDYDGRDGKGHSGTVQFSVGNITSNGQIEDFKLLDYTGTGYSHKPKTS